MPIVGSENNVGQQMCPVIDLHSDFRFTVNGVNRIIIMTVLSLVGNPSPTIAGFQF